MLVFAQSLAVNVAPYLHIGYGAAGPTLDGGVAMATLAGSAVPLAILVLAFWRDEAIALLEALCRIPIALLNRLVCRVTRQGRGPP